MYLIQQKFNKGTTNNSLYFKIEGDKLLIVIIYVDDIIFGGDYSLCKEFAKEMQKEFENVNNWLVIFLSWVTSYSIKKLNFYLSEQVCEENVEELWF